MNSKRKNLNKIKFLKLFITSVSIFLISIIFLNRINEVFLTSQKTNITNQNNSRYNFDPSVDIIYANDVPEAWNELNANDSINGDGLVLNPDDPYNIRPENAKLLSYDVSENEVGSNYYYFKAKTKTYVGDNDFFYIGYKYKKSSEPDDQYKFNEPEDVALYSDRRTGIYYGSEVDFFIDVLEPNTSYNVIFYVWTYDDTTTEDFFTPTLTFTTADYPTNSPEIINLTIDDYSTDLNGDFLLDYSFNYVNFSNFYDLTNNVSINKNNFTFKLNFVGKDEGEIQFIDLTNDILDDAFYQELDNAIKGNDSGNYQGQILLPKEKIPYPNSTQVVNLEIAIDFTMSIFLNDDYDFQRVSFSNDKSIQFPSLEKPTISFSTTTLPVFDIDNSRIDFELMIEDKDRTLTSQFKLEIIAKKDSSTGEILGQQEEYIDYEFISGVYAKNYSIDVSSKIIENIYSLPLGSNVYFELNITYEYLINLDVGLEKDVAVTSFVSSFSAFPPQILDFKLEVRENFTNNSNGIEEKGILINYSFVILDKENLVIDSNGVKIEVESTNPSEDLIDSSNSVVFFEILPILDINIVNEFVGDVFIPYSLFKIGIDPNTNFENLIDLEFSVIIDYENSIGGYSSKNSREVVQKEKSEKVSFIREVILPTIYGSVDENGNKKIEIDKSSIKKNSFEFSVKFTDPDNIFNPSSVNFWANGKQKKVKYLDSIERVDGIKEATFRVSGLIQGVKYGDFKLSLTGSASLRESVVNIDGKTYIKMDGLSPTIISGILILVIVLISIIVLLIIVLLIWKRKIWLQKAFSAMGKFTH